MSQLTNHGENKLADFFRGQGLTLPAAWHLAPLSAYTESSITELTGVGLSRVPITRSLANFAGTQGDGTTVASNGTSHATSNNGAIDFGDASGSGTMVAIGFMDDSSGGNCWMVWELEEPLAFSSSDPIEFAAAQVKFTLGLAGGMSNYLANKLIDLIFRAQAYSMPASMWHALHVAGGDEVGGGVGYARAEIESSMTDWSGTQGAGTTTASSGSTGRISNNVAISHPVPSGTWGTLDRGGFFDASNGGNELFKRELASPITVGAGSPAPSYAADQCGIAVA